MINLKKRITLRYHHIEAFFIAAYLSNQEILEISEPISLEMYGPNMWGTFNYLRWIKDLPTDTTINFGLEGLI